MARNPYLFAVGCPRSGTTLLQRMLDHHPFLAVSNDPHFIVHAIRAGRDGINPPVTPELVDRVLEYRTFGRLGLSKDLVLAAAAKSRFFSDFASALYSAFGQVRGKALAGEKTPHYVRFLPLLDALFPWAKFLHLIRDGRDVALSTLEWARADRGPGRFEVWQERPVAVCALSWRWHVTTGRRDGVDLGGERYHEVRYEDLLAGPEETLSDVSAFLELPYAREMLQYHRGKMRAEPGLSAKDAWLPPTTGLRDWRADMEPRDLELFEAIAGDVLPLFGYERTVETISPEVDDLAERCRESWEAELKKRRGAVATRLDLSIEPQHLVETG